MSEGNDIVGLGATRYVWVPPVRRNIQLVLSRFSGLTANTYIAHPWPGWGRFSVDFWGPGGRGSAADLSLCLAARRFLFELDGPPFIRHTILEHQLWTSFGGYSWWDADDHSGSLRHLHVTYWR